jgi:hypothetical protein
MKSYKKQMDINSYLYDEDFDQFCRKSYERIQIACDVFGIINDEDYYSFKERCYARLEAEYLSSIDKTIH